MMESAVLRDRVTASWVIGQCRDGRFSGILLKALRGDVPALRKKAVAGLARLEPPPFLASAAGSMGRGDLDLSLASAPFAAGGYELWLFVGGKDGKFVPHVRAIDFFVWAGQQFVLDYSVEELVQKTDTAICVVWPADSELLRAAMSASLADKPPEQVWALSSYGVRVGQTEGDAVPRFEADAQALGTLLDSGAALSAGITEAIDKALAVDGGAAGRHLLLILNDNSFDPGPVRAICNEKSVRLHCWSLGDCGGEKTMPVISRSEEEAALAWPCFVASFRNRYVLRARRAPTAVAIRYRNTAMMAGFSACAGLLDGEQYA